MMEQITTKKESTDSILFVQTSDQRILKWDPQRIVDALVRETAIDPRIASIIAKEVENMIANTKIRNITAPLIRELTNAKLFEYGFEDVRRKHSRLGFPVYDVENIITAQNKANANVPHGPEATNMTLAEGIKQEYALLNVFSLDVAEAHMLGQIHLHDLGMIDRPYCSGNSIEYVKKFGLNLPNAISIAGPAKHPFVLLGHLLKMSACLQGSFAGAIGWDALNIFVAPYLKGIGDNELKQLSQNLIFEFAQQAVARGGQSIFSDINLYWEIPKHFADVKAIGPGGVYTGNTYSDYTDESQRFMSALMDVYLEGDKTGRPFFFPKPDIHITDKFFKTEGNEEILNKICEVAAVKGNSYFVMDRGDTAKISECCRLAFKLEASDLEDAKQPWKMRYSAMQNVTINLPRIGYESSRDETKMFEIITDRMKLVAKAHQQKKKFIASILNMGSRGPLNLLAMELDGEPYYRLNRATFLIGMLGLNELVQYMTGEELHQSVKAMKFGLKVIAHMNRECEKLKDEFGLKFVLEQTPAESTAYRMAKLDYKSYALQTSQVIKGDISTNSIYYTNSTLLNISEPINPIDRVKDEGLFHPLIEAGAISHIWLGESRPSTESIANFVVKAFKNSQNSQIAFSPEFTNCLDCGRTARGIKEKCSYCGSVNVDGITRVTGYFSKTSGWNQGKIAELHDRYRNQGFFS